MMYFLLGVLAPIILNLLHLVVGVYVVTARGSVCLLYTSPSPRDRQKSRMPSSA